MASAMPVGCSVVCRLLLLTSSPPPSPSKMDNYTIIKALGQGTWGVVQKARHKRTGREVAIKTIKSERPEEGVNFTAVREIKLLRSGFRHENVIELVDAFTTPGQGRSFGVRVCQHGPQPHLGQPGHIDQSGRHQAASAELVAGHRVLSREVDTAQGPQAVS